MQTLSKTARVRQPPKKRLWRSPPYIGFLISENTLRDMPYGLKIAETSQLLQETTTKQHRAGTTAKKRLVTHKGGCHCGAVTYQVRAPEVLDVVQCDCSICQMKQNNHFIVPEKHFTLLQGADNLTVYTFNTHVAKHTFCKTCGVQSFYRPRSNPDGYGIMPHCLRPGTVKEIKMEKFGGSEWEKNMKKSGTAISSRSKL